jgi:transposase
MSESPTRDAPAAPGEDATIYLSLELSKARWQVGVVVPGSPKMSRHHLSGGDTAALSALLRRARCKASDRGAARVRIVSCYEAGYDGFWLHRWLERQGVENHVLDPASIEVNRRKRRVKTDRIDVEKLMRVLLAHCRGEPRVCSVAHVPSAAEEDDKRRHRERERLIKERGAHLNRIKALLHAQGIRDANPLARRFLPQLTERRTGDDRSLPPLLLGEIAREHARLLLLVEQIAAVEAAINTNLRTAIPGAAAAKAAQLMRLKSIGQTIAQVLAHEVYYRAFDNRRQVGNFLGLTGTPFDSGAQRREQGISKAGNRRARTTLIELAWLWLKHQPQSELARWFKQRVGDQKGRVRKIAIVALARKLAIALWRYLETGLVPTGAVLKSAPNA